MPNVDENTWADNDDQYELVASQEEIYLEETEEEVYEALISVDEAKLRDSANIHCRDESLADQLHHAIEELITGDSDDPPLSDEDVANMLDPSKGQRL